jgi:hypothetical protein
MSNTDPEYLLGEDVIHALLEVRNLSGQSVGETARDLAQKYTGLRERVKELYGAIRPEVCSTMVRSPSLCQSVEHPVGELGRREHLIVGKVGYASQDIGVAPSKRKARLIVHIESPNS